MHKNRPVNLNLLTIRFPVTAIISILHRISGVISFLFIPAFLWLLGASLFSEDSFYDVQAFLDQGWVKFLLWLLLSGMAYHLIAGLRHIIMDFGIGETLPGARRGAYLTLGISAVLMVLIGIWLW